MRAGFREMKEGMISAAVCFTEFPNNTLSDYTFVPVLYVSTGESNSYKQLTHTDPI